MKTIKELCWTNAVYYMCVHEIEGAYFGFFDAIIYTYVFILQ